jgi:hypothetical protein
MFQKLCKKDTLLIIMSFLLKIRLFKASLPKPFAKMANEMGKKWTGWRGVCGRYDENFNSIFGGRCNAYFLPHSSLQFGWTH